MQVIDHEPHAWFLLSAEAGLYLDVYCSHGPVGYSVLLRLNEAETAEYAIKDHAYLNRLSQRIQDTGPGEEYQLRNLAGCPARASLAAIQQWLAVN